MTINYNTLSFQVRNPMKAGRGRNKLPGGVIARIWNDNKTSVLTFTVRESVLRQAGLQIGSCVQVAVARDPEGRVVVRLAHSDRGYLLSRANKKSKDAIFSIRAGSGRQTAPVAAKACEHTIEGGVVFFQVPASHAFGVNFIMGRGAPEMLVAAE